MRACAFSELYPIESICQMLLPRISVKEVILIIIICIFFSILQFSSHLSIHYLICLSQYIYRQGKYFLFPFYPWGNWSKNLDEFESLRWRSVSTVISNEIDKCSRIFKLVNCKIIFFNYIFLTQIIVQNSGKHTAVELDITQPSISCATKDNGLLAAYSLSLHHVAVSDADLFQDCMKAASRVPSTWKSVNKLYRLF